MHTNRFTGLHFFFILLRNSQHRALLPVGSRQTLRCNHSLFPFNSLQAAKHLLHILSVVIHTTSNSIAISISFEQPRSRPASPLSTSAFFSLFLFFLETHPQNRNSITMAVDMLSVATRGNCDVVRIAAAGKSHEKNGTTLVMDLVVHECDEPNCNRNDGIINKADIRSIRHTRYKTRVRDDEPVGYEKQSKAVRTTPRKHSMIDLTRPHLHEEKNITSGKDSHFKPPQQKSEKATTAVIHDPAVANRDGKEAGAPTAATLDQSVRFEHFLRKLQRTTQGSSSRDKENITGHQRRKQDSSDSGIDISVPAKRSLNPLAKEFAAFSSKESPVVAEKRGSETSMNIPLSILTQILTKDDSVKGLSDFSKPLANETVIDMLKKLGIQSKQPQVSAPPPVGVPPASFPASVPPLSIPPTVASAFGLQGEAGMPPVGVLTPPTPFHPGIQYQMGQHLPMMAVPATTPALNRLQPGTGGMPYGMTPGHPLYSLFQAGFNPSVNQGGFGHSNAPLSTNFGPPPARKPRVPDAMAQQQYEAYIEYRKATDPSYALECKQRQAKRAARSNSSNPSNSSCKTTMRHGA